MPVLTGKEFSKHVNSKYRVNVDGSEPIDLELVEVKEKESSPGEQEGLERFSVYFIGPENICLPQAIYRLTHERMGEFDLFLVAIAKDKAGFRYEAVFNYFKSNDGG